MQFTDFAASLAAAVPPSGLSPALVGLWHQGKGDWVAAHAAVQNHEGEAAPDWVHAHLHRAEGDLGNAGYWYRRAGKKMPEGDLKAEWRQIVTTLLGVEG
jgi:hypothetical protein